MESNESAPILCGTDLARGETAEAHEDCDDRDLTTNRSAVRAGLEHRPADEVAEAEVVRMLADAGYYSAANITACVNVGIEPMLTGGREAHHPSWQARFSEPPPLVTAADAIERMKQRLRTRDGRAWYALRKPTVEPVFGIIKAVMGFRQFLLRGLDAARREWSLVTMAWNIRRMAALRVLASGRGPLCL